jgi:hypothetical protein
MDGILALIVIPAKAGIQASLGAFLDCFVASLLAMTAR